MEWVTFIIVIIVIILIVALVIWLITKFYIYPATLGYIPIIQLGAYPAPSTVSIIGNSAVWSAVTILDTPNPIYSWFIFPDPVPGQLPPIASGATTATTVPLPRLVPGKPYLFGVQVNGPQGHGNAAGVYFIG